MIERYQTPEMAELWSLEAQYASWLEVEMAVCRAWNKLGRISDADLAQIEEKAKFDVAGIEELEAVTHHDIIAFVSNVAHYVGPAGRFIHLGLTSSDVLDTASALRLTRGFDLLLLEGKKLIRQAKALAHRHKKTLQVGRSHGVHAEPMTFGLKVLGWVAQLQRALKGLERARNELAVGAISGAIGTYAHGSPQLEKLVCDDLGLGVDESSTQVIARDRHAEGIYALARWANALDRIALEIRHLQRTEVLELLEPFAKGQKGSSAMPHKKNPVMCERLCGMARLLRGYVAVALDNVTLWHERDISHSSNERVMWPDSFHLAHYMTRQAQAILEGLTVDEERMKANLESTGGLVYSQRVLLALVSSGMSREDAYKVVQTAAMDCWAKKGTLKELLLASGSLPQSLQGEAFDDLFTPDYYLGHVDQVFARFPLEED